MKNMILLCVIAVSASVFAASPAATQQWVRNYVSTNSPSGGGVSEQWVRNYIATNATTAQVLASESVTNGLVNLCISNATDCLIVQGEIPHKLALVATNVTTAAVTMGVTNGMMFAWNGSGEWHNGPSGIFISCVSNECFRFNGQNSVRTNGVDSFAGYFDVFGMKIPPSVWQMLQPNTVSRKTWNIFPCAYADTWRAMGNNWYAPADARTYDHPSTYHITDAQTLEVKEFSVWMDEDGNWQNNYKEVVESMRQSVKTIGMDLAGVVEGVVANSTHLQQLDQEFNTLAENLDSKFLEVWKKLDLIEEQDKDGNKQTKTRKESTESKTVYIVDKIIGGAQVDDISLETNKSGRIAMKNYPRSEKWTDDVGWIPFYSTDRKLDWYAPIDDLDKKSIKGDPHPEYPKMISNTGAEDRHGIHIAGWYKPESAPNACTETIAGNLSRTDNIEQHYVLTKKSAGTEIGELHYMRIGRLAVRPDDETISTNEVDHAGELAIKGAYSSANQDKALFCTGSGTEWRTAAGCVEFYGTDGSHAVATNRVTFAADEDTNYSVKVTDNGGGKVELKIGVYYK